MVGEVIAGLSAIKTAFDLAKGLKDIDDAARRNSAVIELQEKILTAQSAQAALVQRVGDLEKEVAGFEAWERQKDRYELQKLPPGVFVYVLKKGMSISEPEHHICAKCYEHRKRSILHSGGKDDGLEVFTCHECGTQYYVVWHPSSFGRVINYDED